MSSKYVSVINSITADVRSGSVLRQAEQYQGGGITDWLVLQYAEYVAITSKIN